MKEGEGAAGGKVLRIFARKTGAKLAGNEQVCVRETGLFENPHLNPHIRRIFRTPLGGKSLFSARSVRHPACQ